MELSYNFSIFFSLTKTVPNEDKLCFFVCLSVFVSLFLKDKSRGGCSKAVIENTFSRYTFVEGCDIMYLSFLMTFAISPWRTIETFGGGTVPRLIELPLPLRESFGKLIAPTFARNASLKRRKAPLLELLLGTIL